MVIWGYQLCSMGKIVDNLHQQEDDRTNLVSEMIRVGSPDAIIEHFPLDCVDTGAPTCKNCHFCGAGDYMAEWSTLNIRVRPESDFVVLRMRHYKISPLCWRKGW